MRYNTKIGEGQALGLEALHGESEIEEIRVECFERNSFDTIHSSLGGPILRTFD